MARAAELPPPVRRRPEILARLVAAELIIRGALFRVLERIRVILVRELAISLLDRVHVGVALDAEDRVVILVFHFDLPSKGPKPERMPKFNPPPVLASPNTRENAMRRVLLALCSVLLVAPAALAQSYPGEPIRIIVPYSAGGGTDIVARAVGQKLSDRWGQS